MAQRFTVRPFSKPQRADLKDALRIYLSPTSLLSLKLQNGEPCSLISCPAESGASTTATATTTAPRTATGTAIAWTATEKIQDTVVQTSKLLQELCGLRLGDKIAIVKVGAGVDEADVVRLRECTTTAPATLSDSAAKPFLYNGDVANGGDYGDDRVISGPDVGHWEWFMEYPLSKTEYVCAGMQLSNLELKGRKRSFVITQIEGANDSTATATATIKQGVFRFSERSTVRIVGDDGQTSALQQNRQSFDLDAVMESVGGLKRQISQIKDQLQDFDSRTPEMPMPSYYRENRGIMLYGPKGTGKSLLLKRMATGPWQRVFNLTSSIASGSPGSGERQIRDIFSNARRFQPSLILIDQLDFLAPRRKLLDSFSYPSLAPVFCEALDGLDQSQVLVFAATRHPNDVDESLRAPTRFGLELELPVPDATARLEILRSIRGPSDQPNDALLEFAAEKTHGFVGADLFALLQTACRKGKSRSLLSLGLSTPTINGRSHQQHHHHPTPSASTSLSTSTSASSPFIVTHLDIEAALMEIRPTAMREIFLETPKVHWSDIGGQHEIKKRLRQAVERPLKLASRMRALNLSPKKGVLLYGPPGCSKTLLVKALATEAGLNFLAVKGAEMLSMYVGESERAVREIFRKARSASPSIIFFDEIDAVASKRSSSSSSSSGDDDSGGGSNNNNGVNVLTTLLNEMDGIEELKNVLVVAATNKPETLDPALMRPGRLDNLFYVGPPDRQAREEIFALWIARSSVTGAVDPSDLAEQTEGYSGAEIVSICETAGELVLDEEEEEEEKQEESPRVIERQIDAIHFQTAMGMVKRQITQEVRRRFEDFGKS